MAQESSRQENQSGPNINQGDSGQNAVFNINVTQSPTQPVQEKDRTPEEQTNSGGCGLVALLIIGLIVAAIGWIISEIRENETLEPNIPLPSGVSRSMVLKPVAEKIANCAKEVVLEPRNCPQSVSAVQASKVRWSLHGYPVDGSVITFNGRQIIVKGVALMTVSFRDYSGDRYEIKLVPYQAITYLQQGEIKLGSLTQLGGIPSEVRKQQPNIDWLALQDRVRATFDSCISSRYSPMPPSCPRADGIPSTEKTTWTLESDPLLNASYKFDDDTGLLHVIGSYAVYMEGVNWLGRQRETQSGDYDALVVIKGSDIKVLGICHDTC